MGLAPLAGDAATRLQWPTRDLLQQGLPALETASTPKSPGSVDDQAAYLNGSDSLAEAFDAVVYQRQSSQTAITFNATHASLAATGADGQQVAATSDQLEFSFFHEVRSEELAQFQQRSSQTAEGLDGSQRSTYLQASQRVAARFEFSLSISGESLSNFAGATEEASNGQEFLQKLLGFANDLLDKADALFNEFFSALAGGESMSFEDLFHKLQDTFSSGGMLDAIGRLLGEGTAPASGTAAASAAGAVQLEFSFSASFESSSQVVVQQSDPVMLDLDGDGFELTSHTNGAKFDILGKGGLQNTAFVTGGDAFLALDRNANGMVDSGNELFGDQRGAKNGYEELRKLDQNRDGLLNASDADFSKLLLFRDDGDGRTEAGELISLKDAGITEIDLKYAHANEAAAGGNRMAQLASYRRVDGSLGRAGDAVLNYTA